MGHEQVTARWGEPPYLHGDVGRLQRHAVKTLITTAATTASQEDTGWAEYVGYLIGVLIHNVHQLRHRPAVTAAPHFAERHHYGKTEGPGQVNRDLFCDVQDLVLGFSSHKVHLFHEAPGPIWGISALD